MIVLSSSNTNIATTWPPPSETNIKDKSIKEIRTVDEEIRFSIIEFFVMKQFLIEWNLFYTLQSTKYKAKAIPRVFFLWQIKTLQDYLLPELKFITLKIEIHHDL